MDSARPPAVAGAFYPADPTELRESVDRMLAHAVTSASTSASAGPIPKAIVVPHAGYVYSGPIAATGYASLREARGIIRRVVLLGPCHRVAVRGIAVPDCLVLETPLGDIAVDRDAVAQIEPLIVHHTGAHAREHSLEVQLPFLQRVLGEGDAAPQAGTATPGGFRVVPLCVGDASAEDVARVIELLWGGPETLIVVSSDLSHYLPYAVARGVDQFTAQRVLELCPAVDASEACGATPLNGLLLVARHKRLRPALLDLRSSGDTAGTHDGVVGYGAFGFYEGEESASALRAAEAADRAAPLRE
jgi:AmmeMemoRadiSam system protein B